MANRPEWDPLRELQSVQRRMNALFETALARTDFESLGGVDGWQPVCDVYEAGGSLVLMLELPGLTLDQIDVRIEDDELVVSGERRMATGRAGEHYHRIERSYGTFARRFRVPSSVDRERIQASYRDGVLRVDLPSGTAARGKPIQVRVAGER